MPSEGGVGALVEGLFAVFVVIHCVCVYMCVCVCGGGGRYEQLDAATLWVGYLLLTWNASGCISLA